MSNRVGHALKGFPSPKKCFMKTFLTGKLFCVFAISSLFLTTLPVSAAFAQYVKTKVVSTCYDNSIQVYDDENLHLDKQGHVEDARIYQSNQPFFPFKWSQAVRVKQGTLIHFFGAGRAACSTDLPAGSVYSCTLNGSMAFTTPNGKTFLFPPGTTITFDVNGKDPNGHGYIPVKARVLNFQPDKDVSISGQLYKNGVVYYLGEDGTIQ
jgi:hypothetical protein